MQNILKQSIDEIKLLCKSLRIKRLYAFGSVVSERFNEQSDIDFLISFDDTLSFSEYTDNYFSLHNKLRNILKREIDIVTEKSLSNPYFIESINETKELIYEA